MAGFVSKKNYEKKESLSATQPLVLIALMTAVTCILGPFSLTLPISPVPISLGILAVYFSVFALGMIKGFFSCLLYLLLGLVGLPVFTGFAGGPAKVFGPTGGYLLGFLFLALIAGFFIERSRGKWYVAAFGMILGTAVCYFFGSVWLAYQLKLTFLQALWMGVIPYIPADIIKMLLALIAGIPLRQRLFHAGLIS